MTDFLIKLIALIKRLWSQLTRWLSLPKNETEGMRVPLEVPVKLHSE